MPSKDYELFIWSCFPKDFHAAREGLLHDSLLRLEGEERQMAIDLLMGKLTGLASCIHVEERVIEAIGWLKLKEAIPPLQRRLAITISPFSRALIGLSLYRITGYPQGVGLAIKAFDITPISSQYNRLRCADYLMVYAKEYKSAVRRLLQAVDDRDNFVAFYSFGLLKFIFEENSQLINHIETILETLVEHKKNKPNEISTRKIALAKASELIEIEFQSNPQWH